MEHFVLTELLQKRLSLFLLDGALQSLFGLLLLQFGWLCLHRILQLPLLFQNF